MEMKMKTTDRNVKILHRWSSGSLDGQQVFELLELSFSFCTQTCTRVLYARAMNTAARRGTGRRVTRVNSLKRRGILTPIRMRYWTLQIENTRKNVPMMKVVRLNSSILRTVVFFIMSIKTVQKRNVIGAEVRIIMFLAAMNPTQLKKIFSHRLAK